MSVWNIPLPPQNSGAGLSLLPMSAWPRLGTALRLSPRELQIVQGVFDDRKEESIAHELSISPHTVNTYFQRLYGKLGVSSRPRLIIRVMAEYLMWNVPVLPLSAWPRLGMALRLSPREMQIVRGVFDDRKEESIAYDLSISPHTVNTYFQRLYAKLRVSSRPQLIVRVMAEYLTMAPDEDRTWLAVSPAHLTHEYVT